MIYTDGTPTIAWADPYVGDSGDEDPSTWNDQPAKEAPVLLTKNDITERVLTVAAELRGLAEEIQLEDDGLNPNDISNAVDEIRDAADEVNRLSGKVYNLKHTDLEDAAYEADNISRELDDLYSTLRDLAETVESFIR